MSDEYNLLDRIGKGSYGQVFKAIHILSGQTVAIKVIDMDTSDDDLTDIRREISLLSKCDSNLITRYHKSLLIGPKLWVVMDYAEGGSIRHILKSGVIPEASIAIITQQVVLALQYLHNCAQIIHRDIKAANILLKQDGGVQLCDFGVAGVLSYNTRRNSFVGTPYWMAPEIINRQQYNYKADIWSLGITVIEMATGNPPFADQDPRRALFLIPKSKPPKLKGNEFSSSIKDFISICLNEEPEDRPGTDELLKHKFIRNVIDGPRTLRKLLERHRAWKEKNGSSEDEVEDESDFSEYTEWDFDTIRSGSPTKQTMSSPVKIVQKSQTLSGDMTPRPNLLGLNMIGPWNISQGSLDSNDSTPPKNTSILKNASNHPLSRKNTNVAMTKPEPQIRGRLLHAKPINAESNHVQSGWQGMQGWQGWANSLPSPELVKTPIEEGSNDRGREFIQRTSHQNTTSASSLSVYLDPKPSVAFTTDASQSRSPISTERPLSPISSGNSGSSTPMLPKPILKSAQRPHSRTHSRQVSISLPNKEALSDVLQSIQYLPVTQSKRISIGSVDIDIGDPVVQKIEHVIRLLEQLERVI